VGARFEGAHGSYTHTLLAPESVAESCHVNSLSVCGKKNALTMEPTSAEKDAPNWSCAILAGSPFSIMTI
jgi:hypothetical protein